jgi:integrase
MAAFWSAVKLRRVFLDTRTPPAAPHTGGRWSHVSVEAGHRHTFCSHLATRGVAPKAIQELVGHATLSITLRYMRLAPSALHEAIGLLDFGQPVGSAERAGVLN